MSAGQFIQPLLTKHDKSLHKLQLDANMNLGKSLGVVSNFGSGHGWTLMTGAGTAMSDDTTYFESDIQGMRLTNDGATNADARKTFNSPRIDLRDRIIQINFYIHDITKTTKIDAFFDVSSSGTFNSYFATALDGNMLRQGWNYWAIMPERMATLGSTPPTLKDLKNTRYITLRTTRAAGETSIVTFDRVLTYERSSSKGKVTLTFDDGFDNVFTEAKRIMDEYGFPGVAYVNTGTIGTSGKLTLEELQKMQQLGWDISSHGKDHTDLVTGGLTSAQVRDQMVGDKQWLLKHGFYKGAQHFATPYGSYNDAVLAEIKRTYVTHRTVKERSTIVETYPPANPYELPIRTVLNTNTVEDIQGWIDLVSVNRGWLILMFHRIEDPADVFTKVTPTVFKGMVDYLAEADVDVVTMSDVLSQNSAELFPETSLILEDKTLGTTHRLSLDNGVLGVEDI